MLYLVLLYQQGVGQEVAPKFIQYIHVHGVYVLLEHLFNIKSCGEIR